MVKILELTADIKNPQADRRSKDWNKLPVLNKGQRFTLHDGREYDYIYSSDHPYHQEVADRGLGKLIVDNSVVVEPKTLTEMKRVYDIDYPNIEEALFKLGRIEAADFEAVAKYFAEDEGGR